jgi:hypothetical protein
MYRFPRGRCCIYYAGLQQRLLADSCSPEDRDKTTFKSHYEIYRFLRLPFGLRNAPTTFQRAIDNILSGVKWKTCLVYLDDVIVFSSSRDAHLKHVNEALTLLGNSGLSLKLKKCHFFSDTVEYLGHVIRPGRLGVAEKNTTALRTAPLPRTQTEIRSFLGLCNVYRRFVPLFSTLAAPLNTLLCKGMPPQFRPIPQNGVVAFNTLRDRLLSPPVLALPERRDKCGWIRTPLMANSAVASCNSNQMVRPFLWVIGPALLTPLRKITLPPKKSVLLLCGRLPTSDPTSRASNSQCARIITPFGG